MSILRDTSGLQRSAERLGAEPIHSTQRILRSQLCQIAASTLETNIKLVLGPFLDEIKVFVGHAVSILP